MPPTLSPAITIRPLTTLEAFERCIELQVEVWGYSDSDIVPKRMFVVAQKIGGQVLGAFDTAADPANIVGFAFSWPGYRNGHAYLHSHMLAVSAKYRDAGIGRTLKLAQRDEALARGIDLIEWTFDPLEIKNAYLNIEKLGAISRRYQHDFYGPSSSPLQGGLPTDRLYAEWWLRSHRVESLLNHQQQPRPATQHTVAIPHTIYDWKKNPADRPKALAVQTENRAALDTYFQQGLAIVGFQRDAQGNGAFEIGAWDESFLY